MLNSYIFLYNYNSASTVVIVYGYICCHFGSTNYTPLEIGDIRNCVTNNKSDTCKCYINTHIWKHSLQAPCLRGFFQENLFYIVYGEFIRVLRQLSLRHRWPYGCSSAYVCVGVA